MSFGASLLGGLSICLRLAALPFLAVGWVATPILWLAGRCRDRAREWDPHLWARNEDPRSDTKERRP